MANEPVSMDINVIFRAMILYFDQIITFVKAYLLIEFIKYSKYLHCLVQFFPDLNIVKIKTKSLGSFCSNEK